MFRKLILSTLVSASVVTPLALTAGVADGQEYYGRGWHDRGWRGPPPGWRHHHHQDYGGVVAGGLATGLFGSLIVARSRTAARAITRHLHHDAQD